MSLTLAGLASAVLAYFFQSADVEVASESIQTFIEVLWLLGSAIAIWYGRVRKGDVDWLGRRQ